MRHLAIKKKSYLITQAWNKEILQLWMALDGTFSVSVFFFFSFNLFMSLWFHCSHTAIQRQSSTNCGSKDFFEVTSKSKCPRLHPTQMFSTLLTFSLFSDVPLNNDVEMLSQNPGKVQLQVKAPTWAGLWLHVIVSMCRLPLLHTSLTEKEGARWTPSYLQSRWKLFGFVDVPLLTLVFTFAQSLKLQRKN